MENIKKYLLRNHDKTKDILIYEYQNEKEYIIHYNFDKLEYEVFDLHTSEKINGEETADLLEKSEILCEYIYAELVVLQVKY